jgi:hypothetical protein
MCPAMSSFCLITTFVKDAAITRKTARCWISTNVHNASCYLVAIEPPLEELYSLQVASCVQHLTVNTMLAHQYVTYLICWLKQLSYILFPMYNRWRPVFGTIDLNPTEGEFTALPFLGPYYIYFAVLRILWRLFNCKWFHVPAVEFFSGL